MTATIVNLFGGPGCGKSTVASGVFFILKLNNLNVELGTEFAKDLVWEERVMTLTDQQYVWAKQRHKLHRILGKVDIVITDSPLLLSTIYGDTDEDFKEYIVKDYLKNFKQLNYRLIRTKPYHPIGRVQTEDEARNLDLKIKDMLVRYQVPFQEVCGEESMKVNEIVIDLFKRVYNKEPEELVLPVQYR